MKAYAKEIKIALTAIVAIVLLFFMINFLKGINLFKASNTYYVQFKNIAGLAVSNAVYANGYPVGIVRTIDYDYGRTDRVVVGIELDKSMQVPRGTRAELESSLMGGVTMNLLLGANPADNIAKGDTILGGMHEGALEMASAALPQVVALLPKIDSILTNLRTLSANPALAQTLTNAAAISANLNETSAQLNRLMAGDLPEMMARLRATGANLEKLSGNLAGVDVAATMKSVDATLAEVQQFSTRLNGIATQLDTKLASKDNSLGMLLNDRQLYDNLNGTAASADSLLIDLKAHPKRYVHFSIFGRKDK